MPKETVYGSEPLWDPENPAVAVAEVSWSREAGHVQLVTKAINRIDHSSVLPPGVVEGELGTIPFTDGLYTNLDRRGINDLIRYLRRARDQAFGRDE